MIPTHIDEAYEVELKGLRLLQQGVYVIKIVLTYNQKS